MIITSDAIQQNNTYAPQDATKHMHRYQHFMKMCRTSSFRICFWVVTPVIVSTVLLLE